MRSTAAHTQMPQKTVYSSMYHVPPEVRAEEGCEEDGQVLHKRLVLIAAPAVRLWDVGPGRHQRRKLHTQIWHTMTGN